MNSFAHRLLLSLTSGYVFVYFGEILFWATPEREGMDVGGLVPAWILYSFFAYYFLCVASFFRARSVWAVFLAGAVFGWFEEGIFLQTTYGQDGLGLPITIAWTGLAWHALFDVLVGWDLVRRVLASDRPRRVAALATAIGIVYGLWAIFWWNEPSEPMRVLLESDRKDLLLVRFAIYSFLTTTGFVVAHWLTNQLAPRGFRPTWIELAALVLLSLFLFALVTVPARPIAVWVMPPLMGVTLLALELNRRTECEPDAIVALNAPVRVRSYLALFMIPVAATAVYFFALAADSRLPTNYVMLVVSSLVGTGMWIASVVAIAWRTFAGASPPRAVSPADPPTPPAPG